MGRIDKYIWRFMYLNELLEFMAYIINIKWLIAWVYDLRDN